MTLDTGKSSQGIKKQADFKKNEGTTGHMHHRTFGEKLDSSPKKPFSSKNLDEFQIFITQTVVETIVIGLTEICLNNAPEQKVFALETTQKLKHPIGNKDVVLLEPLSRKNSFN